MTGVPLLAMVAVLTAAVIAATVLGWRRGNRPRRVLTRAVGVLLAESLVLLTIGLAVNRSEGFYPSWHDLLHPGGPSEPVLTSRAGALDGWLRDHVGNLATGAASFPWRPAGWADWRLGGPPTLVVPAGYLDHPSWSYPVVLVLSDSAGGWSEADAAAAALAVEDPRPAPSGARGATPATPAGAAVAGDAAVFVLARVEPATTPAALTRSMPASLSQDLRVSGHGWALVGSAGAQTLARRAVATDPARYGALAVLWPVPPDSGRQLPAGSTSGPAGDPSGRPTLPVGVPVAAFGTEPHTVSPVAGVPAELRRALLWAVRQTPPPMAAPAPLIPPPNPRHAPGRHRHGRPAPSGAPSGSPPAVPAPATRARLVGRNGHGA
ncbi:hypothetical protein ACFFWC_24385 [Plantactinospora siamensis]|uniref:Esterase n=1 Tax=Plantactinospora siamensis TaxID=555372 RepID=A0ABV6P8K2_9ACTN